MLEFARGATLQAQVTRRRRGVHGAFTHGADGGHQLPPPASKASALRNVSLEVAPLAPASATGNMSYEPKPGSSEVLRVETVLGCLKGRYP